MKSKIKKFYSDNKEYIIGLAAAIVVPGSIFILLAILAYKGYRNEKNEKTKTDTGDNDL